MTPAVSAVLSLTSTLLVISLFFIGLTTSPVLSQPFLQQVKQATPARRVLLILNYFDTCRAVTQQKATAFRVLNQLDALGKQQQDDQLRRYSQFLRDTYAKNNPALTNSQKAQLFLNVAQRAEADNDLQIAGVCEHFAGQYFYLAEDYGRAFQYLLAANSRFRQMGYDRIPEIHRYLYELAFNYYYLNEDQKVIDLLTEAGRFPPFSPNLHIQTYNTLGLVYSRLSPSSPASLRLAEQQFSNAKQLATHYGNALWVCIVNGNLGNLYAEQTQWKAALNAYRSDYQGVMTSATEMGYPVSSACRMAGVFLELGQLDSCLFYLRESQRLHKINHRPTDFSQNLQVEQYMRVYYDIARRYYQTVGNLPEAYRCADSLRVYQARIDKRYRSKAAALAEQRLLVQKHQDEMASLEQQSQTQRILLGASVGVAALVAGLLGLLYRSSQGRRKQEVLANTEREKRLAVEAQRVADELDRARTDLTVFINDIAQKDALIERITADLDRISQSGIQPPTELIDVRKSLINASLLTYDDWDEFRRRFEQVYPGFLAEANSLIPELSAAEERLLTLSKLAINTRQMSRMLGIAPNSIHKTKYRLHKKLSPNNASHLLSLLIDDPETNS